MSTPPAYTSSATQIIGKFGHHNTDFGTLPTYRDFHEIIASQGSIDNLIQIDIYDALVLLQEQGQSELVIKVPTLGFTDPAFDYDLRPWFATPVSINGYGAKTDSPIDSRPKAMMGVDFMGNEYPLIFNKDGVIDYDAIADATQSNIYTTLKAIYYIYSAEQVLKGADLTLLPLAPFHQGMVLLRPPEQVNKNYDIELEVRAQGHVVYQQSHEIVQDFTSMYHLTEFRLDSQPFEGGMKLDIHVDASAYQTGLPSQIALSIELPGQPFEGAKLTQYYGMSPELFSKVIDAIIPIETLAKSFRGSVGSNFNDFSEQSTLQTFYQVIKDGVSNSSIPIMALSDYFAKDEVVKEFFQHMDIEQMTKADHEAFSGLMQSMYQNEDLVYDLADRVDQMISVDKYYPQAHFSYVTEESIDLAELEATLQISPLGSMHHQSQQYIINSEGAFLNELDSIDGNLVDMGKSDPFFSDESISDISSHAHRFEISADTLIDGAQIIQDFDWGKKDVIDLNVLFENLSTTSEQTSVQIELKDGNTEVWVHAQDESGVSEKFHVATVVGSQGQDGHLPDITDFIEYPV